MCLFLSMLLLTGYNQLHRREMYRENSSDVLNAATSSACLEITLKSCYLFFIWVIVWNLINVSNQPKLGLLWPYCSPIVKFWPNSQDLSAGHPMLPYCRRNNSKQPIQNKPVRSEFKMWVFEEPLGYVVNFDLYQCAKCGNITRGNELEKRLPYNF